MSERFPHAPPSIRKSTIKEGPPVAVKEEVAYERKRALERIFGSTMRSFEFPEDGRATDIFGGLFNHVFDSGTNRNVDCNIEVEGRQIHLFEPAVPIHSRSSLITHSLEQIRKGKDVEFGMIDLQNFRDADFDLGPNDRGIHSADIIINKSARAIRSALKEVWQELGFVYDENSYELGRYGGDEFVIALFGGKAIASKEVVVKKVQEKLQGQMGYYKQHDEIVNIPIQLKKIDDKGSVVEWLHPPKSGNEREIYLEFFQRGTLFSELEFQRIITKYSPQGVLDMDSYRRDYPPHISSVTYPEEVGRDIQKRIEYIKKNHPELTIPFELARTYDKKKPIKTEMTPSRQEYLLQVVENSIFDRLLGDMIYSKSHFGEHVKRGEIGEVYILDFKFLKEINTGMTYADADMEIKKLWERIKETLSEEDRKKIIVSRFAGAFYIGVRKGEKLSTSGKLRDITTFTLFDETTSTPSYPVPIGFTRRKLYPHHYKEFYKVINGAENDSDRHFYTQLIKDIIECSLDDPHFLSTLIGVDVRALGQQREYSALSKVELYALLLKGKRKEARIKKVKSYIGEGILAAIIPLIHQGAFSSSPIERNTRINNIKKIRATLLSDLDQSLRES